MYPVALSNGMSCVNNVAYTNILKTHLVKVAEVPDCNPEQRDSFLFAKGNDFLSTGCQGIECAWSLATVEW